MRTNTHSDFIFSPITEVLKDAVTASSGIGKGIETFPLYDYVMQSTFLKATGFQEQKMKCICWEIATFDYEYRYEFTKTPLGECSSYSEKQKIYRELINQLKKNGLVFSDINIDKEAILRSAFSEISGIFSKSNLSIWGQREFVNFEKLLVGINANHFANDKGSLFSNPLLQEIYQNHLYRHRNRTAHNTSSYQQNLPTLATLIKEEYKFENYFVYFFLLSLIDKIFIALYNKYLELIDVN
mgnify:CR=1 FL=1